MSSSNTSICIAVFIFLHIFLTNCTSKKEAKGKLITKQEQLMVGLQKAFNLTSQQVQSFKKAIEKSKKEESVDDINGLITFMETLEDGLNSANPVDQQATLSFVNATIQEYISNFPKIADIQKAKELLAIQIQIWKNVKEQAILQTKK